MLSRELQENRCTILLYNDSPDDGVLCSASSAATKNISEYIPCRLITNTENIGFIKTMNLAIALALNEGSDILLLNSDAMLSRGALQEIKNVAYADPMTGFVSPRSNNATLATVGQPCFIEPTQQSGMRLLEQRIRPALFYMPRYQYAPTAVGFCLLIKHEILQSFGFLSTDYETGYNEENDYIMRASRCGYRAVLANWAYTFHVGEQSFREQEGSRAMREIKNRALLDTRYPEYESRLAAYYGSERYLSEAFLDTLVRNRLSIALDASAVFRGYNGTTFLIVKLVKEIVRIYGQVFDIFLVGNAAALAFHSLSTIPGVLCVDSATNETFDIVLRIGQPFEYEEIIFADAHAPVNVYFMLDTIAIDCGHLYSRRIELIWEYVANTADGIIYNSYFTREQFRKRFEINPDRTAELVSYHSVDCREYKSEYAGTAELENPYTLIVGNHFPHKNVAPTYRQLIKSVPERNYAVIGGDTAEYRGKHRKQDNFFKAGEIADDIIDKLYREACVVVFPSYYEGFGFPILKALSECKPVVVRDNKLNREISSVIKSNNVHLYASDGELAELLKHNIAWQEDKEVTAAPAHNWTASAVEIVEFCIFRRNNASAKTVMHRRKMLNGLELSGDVNVVGEGKERTSEISARRITLKSLSLYSKLMRLKEYTFIFSSRRRKRYRAIRVMLSAMIARNTRSL